MPVTLYHNPKCSTSRAALALLRDKGIEPAIRDYLKTPLGLAELKALAARLDAPLRDLVRWKEKDAVAAADITADSGDTALLKALAAHPILLQRPIVEKNGKALIARPAGTVTDIL